MKTTKKHFELFTKECQKWIARLGLTDWRIEIFHSPARNNPRARAWCDWDVNSRCAGIHLSDEWPEAELCNRTICRSAFHEVMHVVLGRLYMLSRMRFLDCDSTLGEEVHTIIRRLENGVFENEYKKTRKKA